MKKPIKLSLLAIFLGIHPVSCDKYDQDPCADIGNHSYYITDIDFEAKDVSNLGSIYSVYNLPSINSGSYYAIDSVAFIMSFKKVDLASRKSSAFFGFQNIAMACSPFYLYQNPIEKTEAIYTGPEVLFNDSLNLVPGDTITKMFNYSDTYYGFDKPEPLENLEDRQLEVSADILITFFSSNRDSLDFHFDLITTLTDGKVFKSEDITVKLLPSK